MDRVRLQIIRWVIYLAGMVCFASWVIIRVGVEYMPDFMMINRFDGKGRQYYVDEQGRKYLYGHLYENNWIKHFCQPFHIEADETTMPGQDINRADILAFGDSFFRSWRQRSVPKRLADSTGLDVYIQRINDRHPLEVLEKAGYKKGERKILIWESVERFVPRRLRSLKSGDSTKHDLQPNKFVKIWEKASYHLFLPDPDRRYAFLLQHIKGLNEVITRVNTFNFEHFGYISSNTPLYSLDPPVLFYHQTVNDEETGFYHNFSDADIDLFCDNLLWLKNQLDQRYNIELVFMPVPNKYTIYHTLINNDTYNGLLPRIYNGLKARGVRVVQLYAPFKASPVMLYYPTDTHWNDAGVSLALQELMKELGYN